MDNRETFALENFGGAPRKYGISDNNRMSCQKKAGSQFCHRLA